MEFRRTFSFRLRAVATIDVHFWAEMCGFSALATGAVINSNTSVLNCTLTCDSVEEEIALTIYLICI
jgi:hypothetical protein